MTKMQTVELLQKQLPGFYSVEQVIKMINDIDDADDQSQAYNENQLEELVDAIRDKISTRLRHLDSSDVVEFDTAEFELNGNEISLYNVDFASDSVADEAAEAAEKALQEYFAKASKKETA